MTHQKRKRRGRHLKACDALTLANAIADVTRLHESLTKDGYVLKPTIRPYLRVDGLVTLRFVWRKNAKDMKSTFESTVHVRVRPDAKVTKQTMEGEAA